MCSLNSPLNWLYHLTSFLIIQLSKIFNVLSLHLGENHDCVFKNYDLICSLHDKDCISIQWESNCLGCECCWYNWLPIWKRAKPDPQVIPRAKLSTRWLKMEVLKRFSTQACTFTTSATQAALLFPEEDKFEFYRGSMKHQRSTKR